MKKGRKEITGIYKITSPSGKIYIGRSYRIKTRWQAYRRMDVKDQPKLFASFSKYGVDSHVFEIIHELPNDIEKEVIEQYEVLYESCYKDCGKEFLNLAPTGRGIGKLKVHQAMKGGSHHNGKPTWAKGKFGVNHNRSIKIMCNGVVYNGISEAHRLTGIPLSTIHYSLSMNKKLKTGMHFQMASII